MNAQETMLHQTLAKVHDNIEPSPDLLANIRVAIAVAERRRRIRAIAVCVALLSVTTLALFLLVTLRLSGN